jgi:hypothetical protein
MRRRTLLRAAVLGTVAGVAAAFAEAEPPGRVVVAGGDLTEIAFALGAGDRIVGVDATSTHPPEADDLPDIGYFRRLSAEGVLSLAPDLLLAAPETGPEIGLEQIAAAGVEIRTASGRASASSARRSAGRRRRRPSPPGSRPISPASATRSPGSRAAPACSSSCCSGAGRRWSAGAAPRPTRSSASPAGRTPRPRSRATAR